MPWRSSVLALALTAATTTAACDSPSDPGDIAEATFGVDNPDYRGCFADSIPRAFTRDMGNLGHQSEMTPELCVFLCDIDSWNYAAVQYYGECYCGQVIAYEQRPDSECNTPCNGDPSQMCGGAWRNSVYLTVSGGGGGGSGQPPLLESGQTLFPGQSIQGMDGTLVYQGDGNLVLYQISTGVAHWASNTAGTSPGVTVMQGDGNLVVYDAGGVPVWSSGTHGNPGAHAELSFFPNIPRLSILNCVGGSCTLLARFP